jgi:hypothetical protein
MGEKMGGKMGEERCEGERETAQVSSSVGVVVKCTVVTDSGTSSLGGWDIFRPLRQKLTISGEMGLDAPRRVNRVSRPEPG